LPQIAVPYLQKAAEVIETVWAMAAIPDFVNRKRPIRRGKTTTGATPGRT
jgi:hypothetical protein